MRSLLSSFLLYPSVLLALSGLAAGCSLVGLDDLETQPCIEGAGRSVADFAAGNALCAELETSTPSPDDLAWVCRQPLDEDLYCTLSSPDMDNDGVGAMTGSDPGLDCDDTDPTVFGGRDEATCDGKDNDCDGRVDESLFNVFDPTSVLAGQANRLALASDGSQLAFAVQGTEPEITAGLGDGTTFTIPHRRDADFALFPVDGDALVLTHAPGMTAIARLQNLSLSAGEDLGLQVYAPAIAADPEEFLAAFLSEPQGTECGTPDRVDVNIVTGRTPTASPTIPVMTVQVAAPLHAPRLVALGGGQFLLAVSLGSDVRLQHISVDRGMVTTGEEVSISVGAEVTDLAIAAAPATAGESIRVGVAALTGCTARRLQFVPVAFDLDAGTFQAGAVAPIDDTTGVPSMPAIVGATVPGGFVVGWFAARTPHLRLIGYEGAEAGPSVAIGADLDGTFSFPMALARGEGGGIQAWTYLESDAANGVQALSLSCGAE